MGQQWKKAADYAVGNGWGNPGRIHGGKSIANDFRSYHSR